MPVSLTEKHHILTRCGIFMQEIHPKTLKFPLLVTHKFIFILTWLFCFTCRYGYVEVSQDEKTHQPTLHEQVQCKGLHVQARTSEILETHSSLTHVHV